MVSGGVAAAATRAHDGAWFPIGSPNNSSTSERIDIHIDDDRNRRGATGVGHRHAGRDRGTPEGIIAAGPCDACVGSCKRVWHPPMTSNGRRRSTPGTTSTGFSRPSDLVSGENVFFTATGVIDGDLLRGVRFSSGAHTQSIVMRSKSGTVRVIETYHRLDKLREYASIDFTADANAPAPMP